MGNKHKNQAANRVPNATPLPRMDSITRSTRSSMVTPNLYPQISARISKTSMAEYINLDVNNGVTGTFISNRICAMIHVFWTNHIFALSQSQKIEVACAIFFDMISTDKSVKDIIFKISKARASEIETIAVKFLDMMGWIIRNLITDGIDLYGELKQIGMLHKSIGVEFKHFDPMLQAMHAQFGYYFRGYRFEVKYAMDEIFILIAIIMMGQHHKKNHLTDIGQILHGNEIEFLKSLEICLSSNVGKEYFIRYLKETWCDEISMWLHSIHKFKRATNDKERFFIARNMSKVSLHPASTFSINISCSGRSNALHRMKVCEQRFAAKRPLNIGADFFLGVEREMTELIRKNHWSNFVNNIKKLKAACSTGTLSNPDLNDI